MRLPSEGKCQILSSGGDGRRSAGDDGEGIAAVREYGWGMDRGSSRFMASVYREALLPRRCCIQSTNIFTSALRCSDSKYLMYGIHLTMEVNSLERAFTSNHLHRHPIAAHSVIRGLASHSADETGDMEMFQ